MLSSLYGFLAGIGFCAALIALVWAARRLQGLRARIKALEAERVTVAGEHQVQVSLLQMELHQAEQRAKGSAALLLELKQDALDERDRQIVRLREQVEELLPATRRDRLHLVHRDIGEADLFGFAKLRDELLESARIADHYARRAEFVAKGGRPDEFPNRKGEQG